MSPGWNGKKRGGGGFPDVEERAASDGDVGGESYVEEASTDGEILLSTNILLAILNQRYLPCSNCNYRINCQALDLYTCMRSNCGPHVRVYAQLQNCNGYGSYG